MGQENSPVIGNGNPLPYSYLENHHGQRSLVGYRPRGHKESDMMEHTLMHGGLFGNKESMRWLGLGTRCELRMQHDLGGDHALWS